MALLGLLYALAVLFAAATAETNVAADMSYTRKARVQVNQMDLLSGVPTVLVAVIAFIQIMPSPVQGFRGRIEHFVAWLHASVEADLGASLYTCTQKCHTRRYDGTQGAVERRAQHSVGASSDIGCIGTQPLTADEVIAMVQAGSGRTLVLLARLAQYPHVGRLESAVRLLSYAPTAGRRVILWQWLAAGVPYFFSWLLRHGLPPALHAAYVVLRNFARRRRNRVPMERGKRVVDYRISELARHKIVAQHTPYVRFALSYALVQLAGRSLSVRSWARPDSSDDDKKVHRPPWVGKDEWVAGNEASYRHAAANAWRIARLVAADECSATRLLFACALHSLRVMALSNNGLLLPPPYVITGSFRAVACRLQGSTLLVSHSAIQVVSRCLLLPAASSRFSLLLKRMRSPLGDLVLRKTECPVLLNLALLPLNLNTIDGQSVAPELLDQLVYTQRALFDDLNKMIADFASADLCWSPQPWLLRMVRLGISKATSSDQSNRSKTNTALAKLKTLCLLPFQPQFGWQNPDPPKPSDFADLCSRIASDKLDNEEYCRSMPAWCLCPDHCRGTCTLIVNEMNMKIMATTYLCQPYVFSVSAEHDWAAGNAVEANPLQVNNGAPNMSRPTSLSPCQSKVRLVCITNWSMSKQDDYDLVKYEKLPHGLSHRFDPKPYHLSRLLYQKKPMLLLIHGDRLYINKTETAVSNDVWPFEKFAEELVNGFIIGDRLEALRPSLTLGTVGSAANLVSQRANRSNGWLEYHERREAKAPHELIGPFRNPWSAS